MAAASTGGSGMGPSGGAGREGNCGSAGRVGQPSPRVAILQRSSQGSATLKSNTGIGGEVRAPASKPARKEVQRLAASDAMFERHPVIFGCCRLFHPGGAGRLALSRVGALGRLSGAPFCKEAQCSRKLAAGFSTARAGGTSSGKFPMGGSGRVRSICGVTAEASIGLRLTGVLFIWAMSPASIAAIRALAVSDICSAVPVSFSPPPWTDAIMAFTSVWPFAMPSRTACSTAAALAFASSAAARAASMAAWA